MVNSRFKVWIVIYDFVRTQNIGPMGHPHGLVCWDGCSLNMWLASP